MNNLKAEIYLGARYWKLGKIFKFSAVLVNPVVSGDSTIEESIPDISADFLGTDHEDVELIVIRGWTQAAGR